MSASIRTSLSLNNGKIRLMEVHDDISRKIVREAQATDGQQFHGVWVSGLTQTTYLGVPDTELVSPLQRAALISNDPGNKGADVRAMCAAFDADSGGPISEIPALVDALAAAGIGMIIIEDKEMSAPGQKVNSLAASSASQGQADKYEFAKTIQAFKSSTVGKDMVVTARIESFTTRVIQKDSAEETASVQRALEDALSRAETYCQAGTDAVMIHSKSKQPDEVMSFLRQFRAKDSQTPLVVVPTTYSTASEDSLYAAGANVFIYANQLMRAKIHAGDEVSSRFVADHPGLLVKYPDLQACLVARNFGCLLPKMKNKVPLEDAINEYRVALEASTSKHMKQVAERLLSDRMAGAADADIVTAKELLKINSHQLTFKIGDMNVSSASEDSTSSRSEDLTRKEKVEVYTSSQSPQRMNAKQALWSLVKRCIVRFKRPASAV